MLLKLARLGLVAFGASQSVAGHSPEHLVLLCTGTYRHFEKGIESKIENAIWDVDFAKRQLTPGRGERPYEITAVTETTIEAESAFTTDNFDMGHLMAVLNRVTGDAIISAFASDALYSQIETRCRPASNG